MKFINAGKRATGFALPLLSLRTGCGPCGEFPDIVLLVKLAKQWSMDIVQLLPVNDTGMQTSPYSALSAFALNPIYLRIEDLPELVSAGGKVEKAALEAARRLTAAFGGAKRVSYEEILAGKLEILETLWKTLFSGYSGGTEHPGGMVGKSREILYSIEAWSAGNAWAKPYACFVELKRKYGGSPWWEWPKHKTIDQVGIDALWKKADFSSGAKFWAWLQMRAMEQFAKACAEAREEGIDIMGDIPILMNADSADVWFNRELFDTNKAAGAPPDMYSSLGQNWGFPLYRWDELERRDFSFWKERLASADKFYSSYRIDHVLGFFRIWAIDKYERDGFLGHFVPEYSLFYPELAGLGFDAGRIRWLSLPHVPGWALDAAFSGFSEAVRSDIAARLFSRIGNEDLYLFAPAVRGGADIVGTIRDVAAASAVTGASIPESTLSFCEGSLLGWWRSRILLETTPGQFVPTWEFRGTKAWGSLSDHERSMLDALIARRKAESLALWEKTGRKILKELAGSVEMQACAEDLGVVPPCVPAVLGELGIPGLRVLRWHRFWNEEGTPFVPLGEYPENSVACTSVHDSTNLRQWWVEEADRAALWAMVRKALGGGKGGRGQYADLAAEPPAELDPGSTFALLEAFACARSRYVIYPLQDILAASARYREVNPSDERINVPGTMGGRNWLYRVKPQVEELLADEEFATSIASIAAARR